MLQSTLEWENQRAARKRGIPRSGRIVLDSVGTEKTELGRVVGVEE